MVTNKKVLTSPQDRRLEVESVQLCSEVPLKTEKDAAVSVSSSPLTSPPKEVSTFNSIPVLCTSLETADYTDELDSEVGQHVCYNFQECSSDNPAASHDRNQTSLTLSDKPSDNQNLKQLGEVCEEMSLNGAAPTSHRHGNKTSSIPSAYLSQDVKDDISTRGLHFV